MSNKVKNMRALLLMLFATISLSALAQTATLTGTVKDQTGEPIIGASILEKGTTNGTITDFDGNFTLKVSGKAPVVISYIGMKSQEINTKGKSRIDVTLQDDAQNLDEVVVIGYGTVQKKDLTGSVSSVSAKDLAAIPVTNAAEAITGKMAGVQVTTTEGSPDAEVKIRVRGGGSISQDNSPLYIVDGFPVSSISDIAPTDIQSIDVLKDASSTAIYGARGANGVIIITTKSGQEGKIQVSLGAQFGWKKIAKELQMMNPYEYVQYQYELDPQTTTGQGGTSFNKYYGMYDDLDIYKGDKGTNWQDEVFGRTGNQQSYNISVSGGSKSTKFIISYARNDEKSIMIGSGFSKNNVNAKINSELNKWLSVDFNARLSYQSIDGASISEGQGANTKLRNALKYAPTKGLKSFDSSLDDEDSMGSAESSSLLYDPIQSITDEYKQQVKFGSTYNVGLNWKPVKGLTYRGEFGYGYTYNNMDQVWGEATSTSKQYAGQPVGGLTRSKGYSWRVANTLTYDTKNILAKKDKLNIMIGTEANSTATDKVYNESRFFPAGMPSDEVLASMEFGTPQPTQSTIGKEENLLSYFGRVNYTLFDKYLFTFTMRADGSSKFAPGNRWGYFPSGAVAWRLSDESFMEASREWMSNLKLRLSMGTAGNNRIPTSYTQLYSTSTDKSYYLNEKLVTQLVASSYLPNPNLKWETTVTRNVGLDYGFFNGRLGGTVDFYWNTTKDLLIQAPISESSGYASQYQNVGRTSNRGIELTIEGYIVQTKDFDLSATFNIGFNKNKIDKFRNGDQNWKTYTSKWNGSAEPQDDYIVREGHSIGEMYGYETEGMYSFDDFDWNGGKWVLKEGVSDNSALITPSNGYFGPGALKLKDQDGNGVVDTKDKKVIGNANPVHTGGFSLNARYKGFDLSAFFNWSYGNDVYNANKIDNSAYLLTRKYQNLSSEMSLANRFTTIDPATGNNIYSGTYANPEMLKQLNQGKTMWMPLHTSTPFHSWAVEDGSFLRLNTLSVGYTIPKAVLMKLMLQSARVYVSGYNLWCWTKYSGYDPEVDTRRSTPLTPGVDYSAYPRSRTFVVGLNLTF